MSKKIDIIENCADCSDVGEYTRCGDFDGFYCNHPLIDGRRLETGIGIPDWCPKEDYISDGN